MFTRSTLCAGTSCQEFASEAGFRPGVRVLDQTAAWVLVRRHIEEFGLRHYLPNSDPFRYVFDLLGHVSRAKDEGITAQEYAAYAGGQREQYEAANPSLAPEDAAEKLVDVEKCEELARFYARYQEILLGENCIGFDDQMAMALGVLSHHPDVRKQIQSRWDYILVDEFQDTNIAQIELLKLLSPPDARVCVVGDPDQSIYRFRGASFASFLRFDDTYPNRQPFALTQNYRSTKNVLKTAARLISNNADRYQAEKPVWTDNEDGVPVTILKAPSFAAEAEAVADEIVTVTSRISRKTKGALATSPSFIGRMATGKSSLRPSNSAKFPIRLSAARVSIRKKKSRTSVRWSSAPAVGKMGCRFTAFFRSPTGPSRQAI